VRRVNRTWTPADVVRQNAPSVAAATTSCSTDDLSELAMPADPTERAGSATDRHTPLTESRTAAAVFDASAQLLQSQNRVLERVVRGAPLNETLDFYLRLIEAQSPGMLSSILLLDDDGIHVRHAAAPSLPERYVRAIDGLAIGPAAGSCGTAAYRREPVIVEDIATDPLWEAYRDSALPHGLRACWSTPILDPNRRVLGTFALYFRMPGRPSPRHRQLIDVTTHVAALAILADRDRQEAARRLTQLEEAQRLANMGSYDWDIQSNTVWRSKELCRIFGVKPDEFAPTMDAYFERVHPDDRATTKETIERSARDRSPFDFKERIIRPDGALRHLHSRGTWVTGGNPESARLVGISQDITD
jgi:PAS domain S-box-containing protein